MNGEVDAAALDAAALEERLAALETARSWSPRVISRLEARIRDGDDLDLFRVNPLAYAAATGTDEAEAIDLFLHATDAGVFDMEWNIVCMSCGNTARSFRALQRFDAHIECELCQADAQASLDEYIQVAFTISPAVRTIAYHDPASLSAEDLLLRWHYSHDIAATLEGRTHPQILEEATRFLGYLAPGDDADVQFELTGDALAIRDILTGTHALFMTNRDAAPGTANRIDMALEQDGFVDREREFEPLLYLFEDRTDLRFPFAAASSLPPGPTSVHVENHTDERIALWVHEYPFVPKRFLAVEFEPVLTARRLLSTQTFRSLFRSQTLPASEGLAVADLTFLFTDLRDSTRMYDDIGDATAYNLVRLHFDALESVIAENGGAIVKTIGDAIMATFTDAASGVRAAFAMAERLTEFSRSVSADLVLKIGLHTGPAIAVTSNEQMDYFGQTVNIAARIQGMAGAGELCLSEDVYRAEGVEALVADRAVEREAGVMKGVAEAIPVYRLPLTR